MSSDEIEPLTFTRVNSDACGNPRYAVHFLNLNTREELEGAFFDYVASAWQSGGQFEIVNRGA